MTYEMDIAGLKRDLPLCKLNDELCTAPSSCSAMSS